MLNPPVLPRRSGVVRDQALALVLLTLTAPLRPAFFAGLLATSLAFALPPLLPFATLPLTGLSVDLAALFGFGAWIAFVGARTAGERRVALFEPGLQALLLLLAALLVAALGGALFAGSPPRLVVRQAGALAVAVVVLLAGARAMQRDASGGLQHLDLICALLVALLLAGAMNAGIAVMQYLAPGSTWVPLTHDGRAVGHLRQPNHLATQLLWALLALVALREIGRFPGWLFAALGALLIAALATTASRTGAVAGLLPALWGLCDRRLSKSTRATLVAMPLLLAMCWWFVAVFPPELGQGSGGAAPASRVNLETTRLGLWQQSLRLVEQNPMLGVGWGQFAFAWTLTPMAPIARSPYETFTHAHNLLLHWAVELGLPLAIVLTMLLLYAGWRALTLASRAQGAEGTVRSAALAMVAVVLLHSLLEYPLWHANFLLPTACLFGLALGAGSGDARRAPRYVGWVKAPLTSVGGLVALAALLAMLDYQAVADVYAPPQDGLTTEQRMARASRSVLFGQFGDRFAGTLARSGQRQLAPYREVVFEILDLRLLMSWSLAQAERGHIDKARYLAARLKEFDQPTARQFFEVCATPQAATAFQCSPPPPGLGFRDFR